MRRFYCENCGAEVDERDELCRECGAIFVAIKCPRCGFRGKQHQFVRGCPRCGFLGDDLRTTGDSRGNGNDADRRTRSARRREMPAWLFWVVLALLATSFIVLARIYAAL
tara:strand:+ start:162 stop:491 length:330 start_codon:yes stop_codon:yes gene_type:complete